MKKYSELEAGKVFVILNALHAEVERLMGSSKFTVELATLQDEDVAPCGIDFNGNTGSGTLNDFLATVGNIVDIKLLVADLYFEGIEKPIATFTMGQENSEFVIAQLPEKHYLSLPEDIRMLNHTKIDFWERPLAAFIRFVTYSVNQKIDYLA